jgi:hypothetical protein
MPQLDTPAASRLSWHSLPQTAARFSGSLRQKQLDRRLHLAHAAGRVDARRERIADDPGGVAVISCRSQPHSRISAAMPGRRGLRERAQTMPTTNVAVLSLERHDVRHGAEAQQGRQYSASISAVWSPRKSRRPA